MRTCRLLSAASIAFALAASPAGADAVPGQLTVGLRHGVPAARARALVEHAGGRVLRRLGGIDGDVVRPRGHRSLSQVKSRLRALHDVRYVEPDFYLHATATPNDPFYTQQYALGSSTSGISAPPAWDHRTSCAKIAELDSGVQYDHPDLKGNIWKNKNEIPANGKDDDKDGYVDDAYGVDIIDGKLSGTDGNGHGTHVAGIIAARGNNGVGVSGACWTGTVMPIRFLDDRGRGSTSDAVAGIEYAIDHGAKIANCSFGSTSKSSALQDAVDDAQSAGMLLVVAAGNDGVDIDQHPVYPASFTDGNILTVAATTRIGALAPFSNYGKKAVDLAAPGDQIYSTSLESGYSLESGTSMAAPLVAAAAAMLRQADSKLTYSQLRTILRDTTTPLPALSGKTVSGGLLDLGRALDAVR